MRLGRIAIALTSLAAFAALAAVGTGCGQQDDTTPVACLEGSGAYLKALKDVPAAKGEEEIRVGGESLISECLAENQKSGDLSRVGEAMIEAATALNAESRAQPESAAPLELGFLLGAAQRGSETSEGIHSDLVRRLTVAARFAPKGEPLTKQFLATYGEGFDAGHGEG
jgi:hypothetical protein